MKESKKGKRAMKVVCGAAIVIFLAAVAALVYIMVHHLGQVDGVLCGPGQYYYTDIPNWKEYFLKDYYDNKVPIGVLIAIFFAWALLMFKLWGWLDRKLK